MSLIHPASFSIPTLRSLTLSDDEKATIARLQARGIRDRSEMYLSQAYYLGEQVIKNLRIAVPKELEFLRTIVGWPALAVDPYVERLAIDGFRLPGATDVDSYLSSLWDLNGLDAELPLAVTDALSLRCGYWLAGTGDDVPRVTVESPLNLAVEWNTAATEPRAALQEYWEDDRKHAALLLPNLTITLAEDENGNWVVVDRDEHDLDFVPVVRMANQPRTSARGGRSAITAAIRSITDSACRTLLDLEVARELYSVPGITLLGAAESDFQNADGTAKAAWEAYITRFRAITRDEDGNLPEIHQMQVYDPTAFTRLIDMYASQIGSLVYAPPQDLGLYTQGNPTTAESLTVAENRRNRRAKLQQKQFGVDVVKALQMAVRFDNGGDLPDEYRRIAVDWAPLEEPNLAAVSTAINQQVAAGVVPPTSDVVRKRLGYSAVERQQLEQDSERQANRDALAAIVERVTGPQQPEQGNGNASAAEGE